MAGHSTTNPVAADCVAGIMQSVLHPGPSPDECGTPTKLAKATIVTTKTRVRGREPPVQYNPLGLSKRQEITEKVIDFQTSLREFAVSNGLNPVAVARCAFSGELKGVNMNSWKSFQLISGLVRNGRKFIAICKYSE